MTASVNVEHFDLTKNEDVMRLGKECGLDWMRGMTEVIRAMAMEQRIIFFASAMAAQTGHMCAAIGAPAVQAILDQMKVAADNCDEQRRKTAH